MRSWLVAISRTALVLLVVSALTGLQGCGGGTGLGGTYGSSETLTFEGWDSYKSGDLDAGEEMFESALGLDPTFAEAHNGLGWLGFRRSAQVEDREERQQLLSSSKVSFEKAIAADATNSDALVGLAGVNLALGQYSEAANAANRALDEDPSYFSSHDNIDYRDVHLALAETYFFMGWFEHTPETPDPNNSLHHIDAVDPGFKKFYSSNQLTPPDLIRKIEELQNP